MTSLSLQISEKKPNTFTAQITVPEQYIRDLYRQASLAQKTHTHAQGFSRSNLPDTYVASAYKTSLIEHLKEFFLNYLVLPYLHKELRLHKKVYVGEPHLKDIQMTQGSAAVYTFECFAAHNVDLKGWKLYQFQPPKRKNYHDLDKQVELFLEQEAHEQIPEHPLKTGDWVAFDISIVDTDKKELLYPQSFWIRIGLEEMDTPFQELFVGKKVGDEFYSTATCLQEFFSLQIDTNYQFHLKITDCVYHTSFSIEEFKSLFRLRTNKDMHKKLIEVFSYRNDVSQRREMVEQAFSVFFNRHDIPAPTSAVSRQQKALLDSIKETPDYAVYRLQKDFDQKITLLAQKQVMQTILVDQLIACEDLTISDKDIKLYLNLLKKPRTKEFLYFGLPRTRFNGQEIPISTEALKQHVLREKTVNYVIYHLNRK